MQNEIVYSRGLLSSEEVADRLKLPRRFVKQHPDLLPSVKLGAHHYYRNQDVEHYLQQTQEAK